MAKKKKPPGDAPEPSRRPRPKSKPRSKPREGLPDPRFVEALMKQMLGAPGAGAGKDEGGDTPRSRAEALLHRAFEADDPDQVVALAREALGAWPDCADAYVLLAEQARGPKEALELYAQGVAAGERDLGPDATKALAGEFWLFLPTRPYMRARHGLAQVLWALGRRDESVAHYQEMLRLNPNDNQGVRYNLAACLIETGRDAELADLLSRYHEDGSAGWSYSAALLAFRREGDTPHARKLLSAAKRGNKHVPGLLMGVETLPSRMPDSIVRGDQSEAVDYAVGFLNGWRSTPGAIAWLRRAMEPKRGPKGRPKAKAAKGPTPAGKKRLRKLPRPVDAAWQVVARRLPVWMNIGGELRRPWIVLVLSRTEDLILKQEVVENTPTAAFLWDKLAQAMESPSAEVDPHRPTEIEFRHAEPWAALADDLEDVEIKAVPADRLDLVDDILERLVEHVSGRSPGPGLLEMPGVTPEQAGSFFQAAAGFYRAAPWQRVGGAETVKVACEAFESGPWYSVIIGQMGMTLGFALYEDLNTLVRMRDGHASDEQNARETVALSVTFGDETEIPVPDLDAAESFGWEVAGPEAYPTPIRKERGLTMRPPLAWELRLLEACLRSIPDFIDHHDRDDPRPLVREVATGSGPLTVALSWVTEDP